MEPVKHSELIQQLPSATLPGISLWVKQCPACEAMTRPQMHEEQLAGMTLSHISFRGLVEEAVAMLLGGSGGPEMQVLRPLLEAAQTALNSAGVVRVPAVALVPCRPSWVDRTVWVAIHPDDSLEVIPSEPQQQH